jgi:NAD-dependent deacetylase sirtuin 1
VGRSDHAVQQLVGEERAVKEILGTFPELPLLDLNGDNSLESLDDASPESTTSGRDTVDDSNSAESTVSDLSGLSDMSGRDWKPHAGPMSWIHRQMCQNVDPRSILAQLLPMNSCIPTDIEDICLWKLIIDILTEPPRRRRLRHINTLEDVRRLIRCSSKIMIVTGAGVSVSCGIPDFRSKDGLYARLAVDFPSLPDPQAMFDIHYFKKDPRPFFKFAKEIYPGQFQPSPAHRFIKLVESHGKLLRNYSQNIDTLETVAGIENVIHCHGESSLTDPREYVILSTNSRPSLLILFDPKSRV